MKSPQHIITCIALVYMRIYRPEKVTFLCQDHQHGVGFIVNAFFQDVTDQGNAIVYRNNSTQAKLTVFILRYIDAKQITFYQKSWVSL